MPDPNFTNVSTAQAARADFTDPSRRELELVERQRRTRADLSYGFSDVSSPGILNLGTNPTHQDTVTVGNDVYEFLDSGTGTVTAADANIAVPIGGDVATSSASFVAALNGTTPALSGTFTKPSGGAAPAIGTQSLFAFSPGSGIFVYLSPGQGVSVLTLKQSQQADLPIHTAFPSIALSETLTAGADGWNVSNLNYSAGWYFNSAKGVMMTGGASVTVTAELLAAGEVVVGAGGAEGFNVTVTSSSGALKVYDDTTFLLTQGALNITFGTTGSVDPLADDVINITFFGRRLGDNG